MRTLALGWLRAVTFTLEIVTDSANNFDRTLGTRLFFSVVQDGKKTEDGGIYDENDQFSIVSVVDPRAGLAVSALRTAKIDFSTG